MCAGFSCQVLAQLFFPSHWQETKKLQQSLLQQGIELDNTRQARYANHWSKMTVIQALDWHKIQFGTYLTWLDGNLWATTDASPPAGDGVIGCCCCWTGAAPVGSPVCIGVWPGKFAPGGTMPGLNPPGIPGKLFCINGFWGAGPGWLILGIWAGFWSGCWVAAGTAVY